MVQAEQIIAGDAILNRSRYIRITGTAADGNHKGLGGNGTLAALQLGRNRVRVHKGAQSIDVLDFSARRNQNG